MLFRSLGLLLVCFTHPKRKRKTLKVLSQPDYVHSIQLCHWPSEVTGQSIVACCRVIRGDSGVACAVLTNAGRREKTTPHRRTGCQLFMLQQHGGRLEAMLARSACSSFCSIHVPSFGLSLRNSEELAYFNHLPVKPTEHHSFEMLRMPSWLNGKDDCNERELTVLRERMCANSE